MRVIDTYIVMVKNTYKKMYRTTGDKFFIKHKDKLIQVGEDLAYEMIAETTKL